MLVLSRKKGETTIIGRKIRVTVLDVSGNRVKLGFSGPPDVPIHREELLAAMLAAASSAGPETPEQRCVIPGG